MADNPLLQDFPWTQAPILANAPMSGIATSSLAAAVTSAGGLGLIGFIDNPRMLDIQLQRAKALLLRKQEGEIAPAAKKVEASAAYQVADSDILPVGVGVIVLGMSVSSFLPLVAKHRPAIVWLSFGEARDFKTWTESIRATSPHTKIWVQVGSVDAALQTAQACPPDALVLQGIDAGGHGHARGSSVITLIPEVSDVLIENGFIGTAAMALGASGAAMGTRFLGAHEAEIPREYRREILSASDGGQSTVRSRIFDEMWFPSAWPEIYDGRCLRNACYDECERGVSIDEIRARLYTRASRAQGGGDSFKDVSSLWAGTGVGLVKSIENAGDIVQKVRDDAKQRLRDTSLVHCSA